MKLTAHWGSVLYLSSSLLLLHPTAAALCETTTEGLTGLGEEFTFPSKLSIVDFSASVTYATLAQGATPFVKIIAASVQPVVSLGEDGTLTIAPEGCSIDGAPVEGVPSAPSPVQAPVEGGTDGGAPVVAPETPTASSAATSATLFSLPFFFPVNKMTSLFTTLTLLSTFAYVQGSNHEGSCIPTLTIEIGVPEMAPVRQNFGETDHYLAATVDTVTWGYYDPTATAETAALTMASGETVTVEVITHHSSHDYAKMIRGDPAVEEIFYWSDNQTEATKNEPKLPGTGVHLVTGPINVEGAMPGDILQVDILELDPRYNPATGRCYGTNSQKFAGYQYRVGEKRDGTPYVRTGGTEAITVFEFIEDDASNMLYGAPVYMYRFPNMTDPDGNNRTIDNNPSVTVPHEFNHGYNGTLLEEDPIVYPPGYDATFVTDEGGILYLSPEQAQLDWKVPLRPHIGTLAVMPNNTGNYLDEEAQGGASTIPPSRFGGNIDDWRIGKGGTMYYKVEVPGALLLVGDTHAAQGDSELAGTAMETSMTAKLRVTLHKADSLPKIVSTVEWPLLETFDKFVVHGFAFANYLDDLEDPSTIFDEGASLDQAMQDCFVKTRDWLMDVYDLLEEETIALMTTSVDFGITQVVDGNWGVHADIPKWVFDDSGAPYDYSCTTSQGPGRRRRGLLNHRERRSLFAKMVGDDVEMDAYASQLYNKVTASCAACGDHHMRELLAEKLVHAKLDFAHARA
ncbi:hypothetical protein FisN_3Lh589 [Fistulifera solaris]|uniref:Formamidase n=1 Tax=Fistulifera solaris TaxID=1519565 RepID=A0A1Z5J8Q0_FISSO|nr:hypothetical protein FisN_3Lh589 [Fistulifera solaris]|eukprot:GAX10374.1 hypothetical protein FisN_3Lh589 [Fistulifera solaris]